MAGPRNRIRNPHHPMRGGGVPNKSPNPRTLGLGDADDGPSGRGSPLSGNHNFNLPTFQVNPGLREMNPANNAWVTHTDLAARHLNSDERELTSTIKWDSALAQQCAVSISKTNSLDKVKMIYPQSYPMAHLMLERLTFQQLMYKVESRFSPLEMVRLSYIHGPLFAPMWKQAWESARLRWLQVQLWKEPDDNPFESAIDFSRGPEGVWHHRFFIFWEEECDDYKYSLAEPLPVNQETLNDLYSQAVACANKYLKDEDFGDEIDILLETLPVSSSSFLGPEKKRVKEWETEFYDLYSVKEERNLCGVQSKAPKRPGETRDITVPSPGVLRACKRLNRPLKESLKRVASCPFGKDRNQCIMEMENHDWLRFHYMRDFRKVGLTLPKPVIKAFLEGFFHRQPEFAAQAVEFFCDTKLLINVGTHYEWFPTKTGFHMGFFNEGLTWIQYIVHAMVVSRLDKEGARIRFTAFNDDSLISCKDDERLEVYSTIDQDLWNELAVPLSYNKCGLSENRFIYLEEIYVNGVRHSKEYLYTLSILGAINCINIVHAKEYVNAVTQSMPDWGIKPQLATEKVILYWGTEFYSEEYNKPFLFGGWFTPKEEGLDSSLAHYTGSKEEDKAYRAVNSPVGRPKSTSEGKGWTFAAKVLDMSYFGSYIPPELDRITGSSTHFWDEDTARRAYTRLCQDGRALRRYYFRAYAARKRVYEKKLTESILEDWHWKHPNSILTHHVVKYYTEFGEYMVADAPSMLAGKPARLGFQTLINEGIIRSGRARVKRFPDLIHELLKQGFIHHVPRTKLPLSGYVHESVLMGNIAAYERYWKQTGRFPTSGKRTVLSKDVLFAAAKGIPWQIASWLIVTGCQEDYDKFIIQKETKALPEDEIIPEGEVEADTAATSTSVFRALDYPQRSSILLELLKAADPEWGCSLPLSPAVASVFSDVKAEYLSPEEYDVFLGGLISGHRPAVRDGLDERCESGFTQMDAPQGSQSDDSQTAAAQGVWSDSDGEYGDSLAALFGGD